VARNFTNFLVAAQYPPNREERGPLLILRQPPFAWTRANWSERMRRRSRAESEDSIFGHGHGFFEWTFPVNDVDLKRISRLRVLCEASSRRQDNPQTDDDLFPTMLELQLNDITVHRVLLPNHPHDSRGVLSYLRNGRGAYGYLINCVLENHQLQHVLAASPANNIRLRCVVPPKAEVRGGLTIYGAECGRYPICPTLILEC
jgi:predicted transcriptional regulator